MNSLEKKVVIITGASSGIGEALAHAFAARGADVVLAARKYVTLCELAQRLETKYGVQAFAIACDVSREDDCKAMVDQAIGRFGKIDILINNAGISMRALLKDLDLQVLRKLMDVNFWGTVYCTKFALEALLKSQGSVVGVSSIAGFRGLPGRSGYSASKFAMHGFLETLRTENLKTGLHVLLACPGFTASNIRHTALDNAGQPQGETSMDEAKMMSAQTVADIIVKGVVTRKRTLILTRQGKLAVWMNKLFPAWVDKQVYKLFAKEKNPLIR